LAGSKRAVLRAASVWRIERLKQSKTSQWHVFLMLDHGGAYYSPAKHIPLSISNIPAFPAARMEPS